MSSLVSGVNYEVEANFVFGVNYEVEANLVFGVSQDVKTNLVFEGIFRAQELFEVEVAVLSLIARMVSVDPNQH